MSNPRIIGLAAAVVLVLTMHVFVRAQGSVSQNINIITGSDDQFTGDMYRQRQNETVIGISGINPSNMMAAYNDYRTVDFAADTGVGTDSPIFFRAIARIQEFFRSLWRSDAQQEFEDNEAAEKAAAQAWIGLSFSDNGGTDWYGGLHPGYPGDRSAAGALSGLGTFEAASDPVMASTHNQFFVGGIAFNVDGDSAGFVSRFTDTNSTETGRNIQYDFTRTIVSVSKDFFVDKPSIAVGPTGYVYVAFVQFDERDAKKLSSKITVFRSTDHGNSWSYGVTVSEPLTRNQAPWIVTDPNDPNVVYIGWRVFSARAGGFTNAIVGKKSTNAGMTFGPANFPYPVALGLKAFDQPQGSMPLSAPIPRSNAYPTAVIDGSGAIHVALQEYVSPQTGAPLGPSAAVTTGVPRITVTSSYNGGLTWTPRRAIDMGGGAGTQFMPVLTAVGEPGPSCPGRSGPRSRVMVMFYDARASGVGMKPGTTGYVAGGDKQFDVRIAEASACNRDNLGRLIFGASQQMSQYTLSATPTPGIVPPRHDIVTTPGYGYTAVNRAYPMFCGGKCAFTGDYLHLVPRVPYIRTASGAWKLTTAAGVDPNALPAPAVKGVWPDTRDVRLPTHPAPTLNPGEPGFVDSMAWDTYQPPHTGRTPPPCMNPGSRDQNAYAAEYSSGPLFAAAPQTSKPANIPRAFPLYVENRSALPMLVRLTISSNARASFDYKSFDLAIPLAERPAMDKESDIALNPYSTVTGSVIVDAGHQGDILVTIVELNGNLSVRAGGARTSVTLYTDPLPVPSTVETRTPRVVNQEPIVSKPFPPETFANPVQVSATTPFTQNPFAQNPFAQNPFSQNPFSQNPFSQNPFSQNPFAQNSAAGTIYDVTDYTFVVANAGSDTAAYSSLLNIQNRLELTGNYLFQLLISRTSSDPTLTDCQAWESAKTVQVSSIFTPFAQNPFSQNPFSQNPFSQNPFSQNPFSQNPFSQNPFSQNPFSQNPFERNPFSQNERPSDPEYVEANHPVVSNSSFYVAPIVTETPTPDDFRAPKPNDYLLMTLRAIQISANPPIEFQPDDVGVVVVAPVPDVIEEAPGVFRFDPEGPTVSGGGSAVPVKLAFIAQPSTVAAGTAMSSITVEIQDASGVRVPGVNLPITIAIGANPAGGTLTGTTTRPADDGVATFSGLSIDNVGTGYTLTASSSALVPATSAPFNVVPPLVLNVAPQTTQFFMSAQGVALIGTVTNNTNSAQPNLTLQSYIDQGVHTVAAGGRILTLQGVAQPQAGTIPAGVTGSLVDHTAHAGLASGAGMSPGPAVLRVQLIQTIAGTDVILREVSSNITLVEVASSSNLAFVVQPSNAIAGQTIAPPVEVLALDATGSVIPGLSITVQLVGSGTLSGTLTRTTGATGRALFDDLSVTAGSGFRLRATAAGAVVDSNLFDVTSNVTNLQFVTEPSNVTAGQTLVPPPQVRALDASGNPVPGVTLRLEVGPGLWRTLPVGGQHAAIAIDHVRRRAYIADNPNQQVSVVDADTGVTLGTVPSGGQGPALPSAIAVDINTNRIYVAHPAGRVSMIDGQTLQVVATRDGGNPEVLAVDRSLGKLFVGHQGGSVEVLNSSTMTVLGSFATSGWATGIAVNEETHRVYVQALASDMTVADADTYNVLATIPTGMLGRVAVNEITNRIYVTQGAGGGCDCFLVKLIDGATNQVTTTRSIAKGMGGVAVDHETNYVYVGSFYDHLLLVLDGDNLETMFTVPAGTVSAVAFDPTARRVFVGDQFSSNMRVFTVPLLTGVTAITDASGIATFTNVVIPVAGSGFKIRARTGTRVVTSHGFGVSVAPPVPFAWWPGEVNAQDHAGSNHGILENGATFAAGKRGEAFDLDGVDDYVSTPLTMSYTGGATFEAWVKTTDDLGTVIADGGGSTSASGMGLFVDPGGRIALSGTKNDGSGILNFLIAGPVISDGQFHHVAGTWTGDTRVNGARLFVDGVPVGAATAATSIVDSSHPIRIGWPQFCCSPLEAVVDEVKVYNRALSPDEVIVALEQAAPIPVTSAANDGSGSLREAIVAANARPGVDTITFDVPGLEEQTISLTSVLPAITDSVSIDGTSQPGYSGTPRIILDGNTAGSGDGFFVTANRTRIRGLSIVGFDGSAIALNFSFGGVIAGNYLGVLPDGLTAIANDDGVSILDASFNMVGGTTPQDRNVISGNRGSGVKILGESSSDNKVKGNYIGTDASGTAAVPNHGIQSGVFIHNAWLTEVGGSEPGAGNVVSGNDLHAVTVLGADAYDNHITGNYIGVDSTGLAELGNGGIGVDVVETVNTSIGGAAGARNIISGNAVGIQIRTGAAAVNVIGNYIGTDIVGGSVPNSNDGIHIHDGVLGAGINQNVIANNGGNGIAIDDTSRAGIIQNQFRANGGLAIDLGSDGVTDNDDGDGDDGPNHLQNFPVIETFSTTGGITTLTGTLNSTPNTSFTIQLFSSASCDPSGHGEGENIIQTINQSTDASGNLGFKISFSVFPAGTGFTTTATTGPASDTSEFSACVMPAF